MLLKVDFFGLVPRFVQCWVSFMNILILILGQRVHCFLGKVMWTDPGSGLDISNFVCLEANGKMASECEKQEN